MHNPQTRPKAKVNLREIGRLRTIDMRAASSETNSPVLIGCGGFNLNVRKQTPARRSPVAFVSAASRSRLLRNRSAKPEYERHRIAFRPRQRAAQGSPSRESGDASGHRLLSSLTCHLSARAQPHYKQNRNKSININSLGRNRLPNQLISPKSVQLSTTLYIGKLNSAVPKHAKRCKLWSMSRRIASMDCNLSHVLRPPTPPFTLCSATCRCNLSTTRNRSVRLGLTEEMAPWSIQISRRF